MCPRPILRTITQSVPSASAACLSITRRFPRPFPCTASHSARSVVNDAHLTHSVVASRGVAKNARCVQSPVCGFAAGFRAGARAQSTSTTVGKMTSGDESVNNSAVADADRRTDELALIESPFADVYQSAIASGKLGHDPAQYAAACVLSRVSADMKTYLASPHTPPPDPSWLTRFLPSFQTGVQAPKGAYIWSNKPGCGKTMLTDMMFDAVEGSSNKRREHFHTFALEVHARLHEQRHEAESPSDKLGNVARILASEFQLLVVDEFQVTDISDAVIAHHLFKKLFANGVVLVATSNRAPEELYENGLQRELFEPLIPILRARLEVHEMGATLDYRLRHKDAKSSTYFLDSDGGRATAFDKFKELVSGFPVEQTRISVLGRTLILPAAVPKKRVALCKFEDICERPLSSADYRALVSEYHTIVLVDVPVLDVVMDRNALRRLTNFVDLAYEARVKLIVHAEAPPPLLVRGVNDGGRAQTEEGFAAGRLVSRLIEMQTSDEYLSSSWHPPVQVHGLDN